MRIEKVLTILLGIIISFQLQSQTEEDFFGQLHTVVIDAGHGGKDKGCLGSSSYEKDVALSISLKFGKYLEKSFPDLNVIYTRKTDVFLELYERAKIANRAKADLFICIHANSAAASSAFGTETFVMGNAKTEANMKAAQKENASILLEDNYEEKYENFDPNSPESYIAMTIMQSAFQSQSIEFADLVQYQFRERVGRKDRGVKMAPFLVLHQTTMPSVLIESGFLSNPNEQTFLKSELGQDYIASAIYRAFKEYKQKIEARSKLVIDDNVESTSTTEAEEKTSDKKEVRSSNNDIRFKVQLATTTSKLKTIPENFKGLENVDYYEAGGLFRYTYGDEPSWEAANELQQKAKESGFKDAFIVAFKEKKRIAVGQAVRLLKQDK